MTYKIDLSRESDVTVVTVSGCLNAKSVHELDRICKETIGIVRIDVGSVTGFEAESIGFLKEIKEKGFILSGVSPYMSLLIAEHAA